MKENYREFAATEITGADSFQVALMSETGSLYMLWIPIQTEGKYKFYDQKEKRELPFLSIEAKDQQWYAQCESGASFLLPNNTRDSCVPLTEKENLILLHENIRYVLYMEYFNQESKVFHNYHVADVCRLQIGRLKENDICYPNPFVSRSHALLDHQHGVWRIEGYNNANGLYVNGKQASQAELFCGDEIYIMGLKIIIGVGFLSINDGNGRVTINPYALQRLDLQENNVYLPPSTPIRGQEAPIFNRLPRRKKELVIPDISIEAPPLSLRSSQMPLLLRMGGSMVMGGTSMLAGNFTSMLSMVLFPLLSQKYTEKEKKEYEERRCTKYHEYLTTKRYEIEEEKNREESILNENYPATNLVAEYPRVRRKLWERRKTDEDFLSLRLGYGQLPLLAPYEYPEKKFSLDEDELEDEMYRLAEEKVYLQNVPIMLPLMENFVCSVIGERNQKLEFLHRLLIQIACLHSYDEVKIVLLMEPTDLNHLFLVRYLPHLWNDDRSFRFLATSPADGYLISEYLNKELEDDLKEPCALKKILKERPYYVVLAFCKRIFDSIEVLKQVLQEEENVGVSLVTFFDEVPKESQELIYLNEQGSHEIVYLKEEPQATGNGFQMDSVHPGDTIEMFRLLANTRLKVLGHAHALPKMLTFLEMFGVGKVEHLNPLKRWRENNPVKSLAVPVGVTADGLYFTLDLHEKYQGPHGLVAGMTGSGKSEFIITYILSLAINFHPNEVAFVLIDYKGGGLAGAFDDPDRRIHLPHLVGTITNLDGSAIQRSLMSIESELKRRQRIFNEAKSATDEGTMDIYTYQKLYRSGRVTQPLPHLFIISDEFAELKSQESEFMDQLISAARIGRSLGVHLILATQKPAGVVNDQINSNAKFRVCLKVQTRGDSEEMLRRPEAAELKETGRFYLQVGYNEFFALGQSAWCGAPYEPQEEVVVHRDDYVQFLDDVGQSVVQVKPIEKKENAGVSQLVSIVRYLSELAVKEGIEPKSLWLKPLPARISLQDLPGIPSGTPSHGIKTVIGMVDDPENQVQFPLEFDFQACKNLLIVGDVGSGKSTLMQTMLYTLVSQYSPDVFNYYILDYSSRLLDAFGDMPHCGGVMGEGDEKEAERFFQMLREIIADRKEKFLAAEVNSFEAYCEVQQIPMIFVFIDNIVGLSSWPKGEAIYFHLNLLMREGNACGIKFVFSASHMNDVLFRIKQEIGTRLALRLKDNFEYSDVLNTRCRFAPEPLAGRGVCLLDERPLEYQAARYEFDGSEQRRMQELKKTIQLLAQKYNGCQPAKRLPVLSETETYEQFCQGIAPGRLPLGYDVNNIRKVCMPFQQLYGFSVYFGNPKGNAALMENYLYAAQYSHMSLLIVKRSQASLFDQPDFKGRLENYPYGVSFLESSPEDSVRLWKTLSEETASRKVFRNEYCEMHHLTPTKSVMKQCAPYIRKHTTPLLVLFESFADYCRNVDTSCTAIMPKIFQEGKGYNYYFMACYYPDDASSLATDLLHQTFNPDGFLLLYGGQFQRQGLASLPSDYRSITNPLQKFNSCVMKYHDEYYPLLMPCGELDLQSRDPEEADII